MCPLPDEILDIILKEYWYDYFKRSVIDELHQYSDQFYKPRLFMINHFYKCKSVIYDKQLLCYYKDLNKFLELVAKNKTISLFLLNIYPDIRHVLKSKYLESCYNDIDDSLKYICIYAVVNGNPYMSYYNKQRFIDIMK